MQLKQDFMHVVTAALASRVYLLMAVQNRCTHQRRDDAKIVAGLGPAPDGNRYSARILSVFLHPSETAPVEAETAWRDIALEIEMDQ